MISKIREIMKITGEANNIHNIPKLSGPANIINSMNIAKLIAANIVPAIRNMFLLFLSTTKAKKIPTKNIEMYINIAVISIIANSPFLLYFDMFSKAS